jgi:hypothetical protein
MDYGFEGIDHEQLNDMAKLIHAGDLPNHSGDGADVLNLYVLFPITKR